MTAPKLYNGDDCSAWHARTWTDFAGGINDEIPAILPVYGLTDWGLGRPLDVEEVLASTILDRALMVIPQDIRPLVLPPLRQLPAQHPNMALTVDIETAHRSVFAIARSVQASGCRRLVLFNSNPFCEEWVDVSARDLRIELGLQTFCVNLSGLGLDFHSGRTPDTGVLQCLLTHMLQSNPDPAAIYPLNDPLVDLLLAVETAPGLGGYEPGELIEQIARRLTALITEILQHPPLSQP
jgi:creatinine amidohydrolase